MTEMIVTKDEGNGWRLERRSIISDYADVRSPVLFSEEHRYRISPERRQMEEVEKNERDEKFVTEDVEARVEMGGDEQSEEEAGELGEGEELVAFAEDEEPRELEDLEEDELLEEAEEEEEADDDDLANADAAALSLLYNAYFESRDIRDIEIEDKIELTATLDELGDDAVGGDVDTALDAVTTENVEAADTPMEDDAKYKERAGNVSEPRQNVERRLFEEVMKDYGLMSSSGEIQIQKVFDVDWKNPVNSLPREQLLQANYENFWNECREKGVRGAKKVKNLELIYEAYSSLLANLALSFGRMSTSEAEEFYTLLDKVLAENVCNFFTCMKSVIDGVKSDFDRDTIALVEIVKEKALLEADFEKRIELLEDEFDVIICHPKSPDEKLLKRLARVNTVVDFTAKTPPREERVKANIAYKKTVLQKASADEEKEEKEEGEKDGDNDDVEVKISPFTSTVHAFSNKGEEKILGQFENIHAQIPNWYTGRFVAHQKLLQALMKQGKIIIVSRDVIFATYPVGNHLSPVPANNEELFNTGLWKPTQKLFNPEHFLACCKKMGPVLAILCFFRPTTQYFKNLTPMLDTIARSKTKALEKLFAVIDAEEKNSNTVFLTVHMDASSYIAPGGKKGETFIKENARDDIDRNVREILGLCAANGFTPSVHSSWLFEHLHREDSLKIWGEQPANNGNGSAAATIKFVPNARLSKDLGSSDVEASGGVKCAEQLKCNGHFEVTISDVTHKLRIVGSPHMSMWFFAGGHNCILQKMYCSLAGASTEANNEEDDIGCLKNFARSATKYSHNYIVQETAHAFSNELEKKITEASSSDDVASLQKYIGLECFVPYVFSVWASGGKKLPLVVKAFRDYCGLALNEEEFLNGLNDVFNRMPPSFKGTYTQEDIIAALNKCRDKATARKERMQETDTLLSKVGETARAHDAVKDAPPEITVAKAMYAMTFTAMLQLLGLKRKFASMMRTSDDANFWKVWTGYAIHKGRLLSKKVGKNRSIRDGERSRDKKEKGNLSRTSEGIKAPILRYCASCDDTKSAKYRNMWYYYLGSPYCCRRCRSKAIEEEKKSVAKSNFLAAL